MNKVAIYCRLSDEDNDKISCVDDSESIQNQKLLLTKYAADSGWDIYKIYSDDDYSGLDRDRPQWNQLLKDAEARNFDIVLCKSQSRFTRDMEQVEMYLHYRFVEWGIRFIGLTDNSDTLNKGNKKQRQIIGLTNEWYCEDISENIKAVFDAKRREGKFIGSFASYGYKKDDTDNNRLVIDEEAAEVVKRIFELYIEGYGTQHIASVLNEKCIFNPTKYKQSKGLNFVNASMDNDLGLWNKTTVKRILKNEMYVGNMIQGKRKKVSYKIKKVVNTSKDQWIRVENTHEAIVEKNIFEEVQRRISKRQRSTEDGKAHVFSTKVRCSDCGSTLNKVTAFYRGKKYSYLRCKISDSAGKRSLCTSHSIRLDLLEDIVAKKLREHVMEYADEKYITDKLIEDLNISKMKGSLKCEIEGAEKKLSLYTQILKSLYMDRVKGIITEEQFQELNREFTMENEKFLKIKDTKTELMDAISENTRKTSDIVKDFIAIKNITSAMVNTLIDYIEIGEKNKVTKEQNIKIHWLF